MCDQWFRALCLCFRASCPFVLLCLRIRQNHELARLSYKQHNQIDSVLSPLNIYASCINQAIKQSTELRSRHHQALILGLATFDNMNHFELQTLHFTEFLEPFPLESYII